MMDLSMLNRQLGTDFVPPKTWHYGINRCASFRTRFIVESILDLKNNLIKRESDLLVLYGEPEKLLPELKDFLSKQGFKLDHIHTHKEVYIYAFEELQTEHALSKDFKITYHSDSTMINPGDVNFTFDKTPRVFTPFRKRIESMPKPVRDLLEIPKKLPQFPPCGFQFKPAHTNTLLNELCPPLKTDSRSAFPFSGGETVALSRLQYYLFGTDAVAEYKKTRNGLIGTDYSTKFSGFLAHGCLSPRLIWHEISRYESENKSSDVYWVKFEMLWRDYWRYLTAGFGNQIFYLHGFRNLETIDKNPKDSKPGSKKYTGVWLKDKEMFQKWCEGMTGVPFIDALMREVKLTGFMSNRGRQNAASFLAKDLCIDWRMGAEWFESLLTDHDVYSNYGNWQYGTFYIA
ncbi:DNA photolyase, FAD-binding/Cryptochrome [Phycomyces nitens]|nr:DNA photolyase, FAD-binding/Cryptochrome [Phycomyces nitens]